MKLNFIFLFLILIGVVACSKSKLPVIETGSVTPMPPAWIDKDTGHKIIHLTPREGDNRSFYFHNNPFLPAVDEINEKMIFYGQVGENMQLFSVDLKNGEMDQITNKKRVSGEIVASKGREVFYQCGDSVFATGVENHQTRLIFVFPDTLVGGITTLNADEMLLSGSISSKEEAERDKSRPRKPGQSSFEWIYEGKLRRSLITISVETGEMKIIHSENAWLNHIQFSPTDPNLLMFCHEGPWHKVDRIWTINVTGGGPKLMHKRTMDMEIAGHESFSSDGKHIWFDLQMPRGENFFLASVDIATGKEIRYSLTRNEWSIHFTISPDGKWFAGDGGDPSQVAKAEDGMWIYRFKLEGDHLASQRLVNMKHHNYSKNGGTEPNEHISPDGKWIIFRANFEGHTDIYAVEVKKSKKGINENLQIR
ncbi:MAG TPA: oligogalacturonate lyase family protein [Draconibacterium sp.]|nr:oligogalacturonate lyase family protein [Draconibacterium sp.]